MKVTIDRATWACGNHSTEDGALLTESGNRYWEDVFARFNDWTGDIDDATRESWIATGFKIVLGCDVEFVGEYPDA